ncbi:hypothetical protein NY547_02220 [Cnuibacter physcomitrellae]|uniref:hypothetical protein n=1 Tax=Cnuibacter physcomitrellae TaxID=1619308 RepID=UPI002175926B|nr:hypothetical protein [Cnuibacter physcomitrellae]MCS5496055.1 hypothetical protein [Cnuibacter physcomitrellae]
MATFRTHHEPLDDARRHRLHVTIASLAVCASVGLVTYGIVFFHLATVTELP